MDIRETHLFVQEVAKHAGRPNARIRGASEATVRELVARLRTAP